MCLKRHIPFVTTISIKDLHDRTGHWLRQVAEAGEVVITERGRPVARMLPPEERRSGNPLLKRRLLPGAEKLMNRPMKGPDSGEIISEGRDGR